MSQRAGQWIDGGQQQRGGGSCISAQGPSYTMHPAPPLPPPVFLFFVAVSYCPPPKEQKTPPANSGTSIKAHPQAPHGHPSISVILRVTGPTTWPFPGPQTARPYVFGKVQVLHIRYSLSSTFKYHTPISCFFHPQYCSTNNHVRPQDHRLLRPRYVVYCPSHDHLLIIPVQTSDFPP